MKKTIIDIIDMSRRFSLFACFAAAPSHWQSTFQRPATTFMEGLINLHHDIMAVLIFILVFVSTMLVAILCAGWERGLNSFMKYYIEHNTTHNTRLETIWTIIPTLILLSIVTPSFSLIYAHDEVVDPEFTLRIIGRQWYWSYEFPCRVNSDSLSLPITFHSYVVPTEDLLIGNFRLLEVNRRLALPVGTNIRLLITSYDVIHSWAVPAFGIKVDAISGRLNECFLNVNYIGTFYGQCSEICGVNHGFMPIKVEVMSRAEFNTWLTMTGLIECPIEAFQTVTYIDRYLFINPTSFRGDITKIISYMINNEVTLFDQYYTIKPLVIDVDTIILTIRKEEHERPLVPMRYRMGGEVLRFVNNTDGRLGKEDFNRRA